jgi:tRNA (mo5U34)-methyltransferase
MRLLPSADFDASYLSQGNYYWHQGWEIFPGIMTPGRSLVSAIMDRCAVPDRLDGKRVLDVGAWNGCTSFECERRGAAEVIALSLEDPQVTGFEWLRSVLDAQKTHYLRRSIYDLDPRQLGTFDTVLCFGVIYHLRYPMLGLDNLRRVAAGDLYLETQILDEAVVNPENGRYTPLQSLAPWARDSNLMQFYPTNELAADRSNWWSPSTSALKAILETAGFTVDHTAIIEDRGYLHGKVRLGMPPFLESIDGAATYENAFYDVNLMHLFGPRDSWSR